jgi:flagellar motor switch/type III secretory pathway protein FliN
VTIERVRPFPWNALEPTTRWEANVVATARRWATGHADLGRFALALADLLGCRLEVLVGRALRLRDAPAISDGVGVVLAPAGGPAGDRALVAVEGALAAAVVARALKRPAATLVRAGPSPSPAVAGAFGAILLAASRRAHLGSAMRLVEAGSAALFEAELSRSDAQLAAVAFTVLVDDDAFAARVIASPGALACAGPPWHAGSLRGLGPLPLSIPIVASAACVTAAEISTLRVGDAFIPQPGGRGPHGRATRGWTAGAVWLAPPTSDLGLRADLGKDGRLVLRGGFDRIPATEAHMEADEKDAMVEVLGEVPVVVRVELGEATMAAREWASLGRGDVVGLGKRVGELVLLRVGGVPLARGELVELEGEVAVRIVDRFVGKDAAAL